MQIGDEVIWSAVSAIVVGLTLKSSEFFMNRKSGEQKAREDRLSHYQESVEGDVEELRAENRLLRAESDKYRLMYYDLLDKRAGLTDRPE